MERVWWKQIDEFEHLVKDRCLGLSETRVQYQYLAARMQYGMQFGVASHQWLNRAERKLRNVLFGAAGMCRNSGKSLRTHPGSLQVG